ncbi:MAG: metallophosphoesterase [Deltaproteobacteria bacterium]|nr:metallophosphoesterase [Deltaproteobacteria bacterium]
MLAIGDVHLGTTPSRVADVLSSSGVDPADLTPAAALSTAVDWAIRDRVDAVLFAGDVVENSNARFEAIQPLQLAVDRLVDAGIPVLAVAGNHDVEALPRLAGIIEGFHLLGEGGRWESHVLHKGSRPVAEILGWSFPEPRVITSPVAQLIQSPLPAHAAGVARLGLLHADLGASSGPYAPVSRVELEESGLDAWLLGHLHGPSLGNGAAPFGYLGSLVGLDPTETGLHGPWRIDITHDARVVARQLAIAPLRWEAVDLAVEADWDDEDVGDHILNQLEVLARQIQEQGHTPAVLGVRARLVGQTRHYGAIQRRIGEGIWDGATRPVNGTLVFIDRVIDGLSLMLDLEDIAQSNDPPGLLARKLIALYRGGEERRALLDEARGSLRPLAQEPTWAVVEDQRSATDPISDEALVTLLRQAGVAALDALLAQRRARDRSPR